MTAGTHQACTRCGTLCPVRAILRNYRRDVRTLCRTCGKEYDKPAKFYFDWFPGPSYAPQGKGSYESGAKGKGKGKGAGAGAKTDKGAELVKLQKVSITGITGSVELPQNTQCSGAL